MPYLGISKAVRIQDILKANASLSPRRYQQAGLQTKRRKFVRDFLNGNPIKGQEVGSGAYIDRSPKAFVRTKALQPDSFIPHLTGDAVVPILPTSFRNMSLSSGDLLLSKDSNVGAVAMLDRDYPDHMLSAGLLQLPVKENKTYLFAFLKHQLFHDQLVHMVPKGATIRHAKELFLDCEVPLPAPGEEADVFSCIDALVQMVVRRERQIRENEQQIYSLIEAELASNQGLVQFKHSNPRIAEVSKVGRLDAGVYGIEYSRKQFMIANYKNGSGIVEDWGFKLGRGQNLQVSAIGNSIYTTSPKANYYTLVRPTNLSDYGTVTRYEYLGNPRSLSCITEGDIIFSAEGSIGKCVMFVGSTERLITNIHGIVLSKKNRDTEESAFVSCFLRYLRHIGLLDHVSVGGQGGSLAERYWSEIRIPFFPAEVRSRIAKIYYRAENEPVVSKSSLDEWLKQDSERVAETDTLHLQTQIKELKTKIIETIDYIANGRSPSTDLTFVRGY